MTNSEYYNVFKQRLSADGYSYKEQIQNLARRNFDRYLAETPTAILVKCEGVQYRVSIVENKQDEFRLSKQMLSSIEDFFPIGSLIYWEYYTPKDCPENQWLVWKRQQNSILDYNVSYISRCNHKLKWIDDEGVRHEQYVYEFSSKESMIRATFKSRVQEIIASEPNKFMEIIMPYTEDIKRDQRFIIDGEAWYVIEFDSSSVDGITYITLGEDRKDLQNDSLIADGDKEDLANYKDENKNTIVILEDNPTVEINTSYTIKPYFYKEGKLSAATYNFYINNKKVGSGTQYEQDYTENTKVVIKLASNEEITHNLYVTVSQQPQLQTIRVIVGDSSIKWGKTAIYTVESESLGVVTALSSVTYTINNDELATLEVEGGACYITANSKRKTGKIILTAAGENFSIEKTIAITSLW